MKIPLPKYLRKTPAKSVTLKRYLSDQPLRQEAFLAAARSYVANRNDWQTAALYRKPYIGSNHKAFFNEIYAVLNLIEAMNVPARGVILEVGCGPGWVTEILALMDYEVHAIDPSEDMIEIARRRLSTATEHYKLDAAPNVTFHPAALETGISLTAGSIDGVIFHAALHHVVDEIKGLAECFRLMKPGGVLGVSEWAWDPSNKALEATLDEEMREFGTLENPFSQGYLEVVLADAGFVNIERFHAINGFVAARLGDMPIKNLAQANADVTNNLTARKPYGTATTADKDAAAATFARITVDNVEWSADRAKVSLALTLENTGSTIWIRSDAGAVKVSLRSGELGAVDFIEAGRIPLPVDVMPGAKTNLHVAYIIPAEAVSRSWILDMLAEDRFWFSANGNTFPPV
jgi:SAM-dependent methyltransferase